MLEKLMDPKNRHKGDYFIIIDKERLDRVDELLLKVSKGSKLAKASKGSKLTKSSKGSKLLKVSKGSKLKKSYINI